MALVLNGSGSISGISAGGLPDGVVTTDDLASTLDLSGKTVTLPSGVGGKVLQVVQGVLSYNDNGGFFLSTTSSSFSSAVLNASITPSSTSSKILVTAAIEVYGNGTATVYRNSTNLGDSSFGLGRFEMGNGWKHQTYVYLDSPSTTSSVTYTLYGNAPAGTAVYFSGDGSIPNTITLMEIAA